MAIYKFITDKDIDIGLKKYYLDQVTTGVPHIIASCEGAAVSLMKSKLNNRYDITKVFPLMPTWSGSTAFLKDEYCFKADKIYKAKQDSTNKDPEAETAFWEESDPRDQLLIVHCVNIMLYFLLERINPRKITDDIANGFAFSMEWLDEVMNGKENPDFPLLELGASTIPYGSNDKLDHYY